MLTEPTYEKLEVVLRTDSAALLLGDSVAVMREIESSTVDLIFADPPYLLSNGGFSVKSGRQVSVNKGAWDESNGVEQDFAFHHDWLTEARRILKPDGAIWVSGTYHSVFQCGHAMQALGFRILNDIVWFKPNAAPNLGRRMFTASHETLIWASKSQKSRHEFDYDAMRKFDNDEDIFKNDGKQMRSVWSIPVTDDVWVIPTTPKREKAFPGHPTQKPLALLERIILASSKPGDLVLDPFVGSGTTGVAAISLGRRFVGIDNNKEFLLEIACPRIRAQHADSSVSISK